MGAAFRGRGAGQSATALFSGAATALAFAPFALYPLALLGPAVLLWLMAQRCASARQAAWLGGLFGLGLFGVGVHWIYISLHQYGNAPLAFALLANLLLIALMALYLAAWGYLSHRLAGSHRGRLLVVAPALWVLIEWLRSWLLTGFPWLTLGYSQIDAPLGGFAPIVGVYGISAALLISAAALVRLWSPGRGRYLAVALLIALWGAGWSVGQLRWTEPADNPLTITLVQGNVAADRRWQPGALAEIGDHYTELSFRHGVDSDVIIWPEVAIPTLFNYLLPRDVAILERFARDHELGFLIGIADGSFDSGAIYNAIIGLGLAEGRYYKQRLVPFGEYLPLRSLFAFFHRWVEIPMADFSPGQKDQPLIRVAGQPVGASICYDVAYGEALRNGIAAARWFVNVSNDAWFGDSLAPLQHLQIARMRAREFERPMARATNTGISAFIDDLGVVQQQTSLNTIATLTGQLQPRRGVTPYGRWGNGPLFWLIALVVAGVVIWRWWSRSSV